jgi:hypothetical protein
LEHLEDRLTPATFNAVDVPNLIADIILANGNGTANTINLTAPNSSYVLNAVDNSNGAPGNNGLPVIHSPFLLTINGNGATIERNSGFDFRLFDVDPVAQLSLNNVTLESGLVSDAGVVADGGAIFNAGTLALSHDVIASNLAFGKSAVGAGKDGDPALGGGIYNAAGASLTMTACTLSNNAVGGGNGGIAFALFANGGSGGTGEGGGIFNDGGKVIITACSITNNIADGGPGGDGGGDYANGGSGGTAAGGGIFNNNRGSVTITASTLSGNSAIGGFGGKGNSPTDGASGGNSGNGGQAVGGGIASVGVGVTVTILNSTIVGNQAIAGKGADGGAASPLGGGLGGNGGNGGIAQGGGVFNSAVTLGFNSALTLVSSTIAGGNEAIAGAGGLGGDSPHNITGSNGKPGAALGGGISAVSAVAVENTIVAGNFRLPPPPFNHLVKFSSDVSDFFTDKGHNFIGDGDGSPFVNGNNGDQVGTGASPFDPKLGPLQDNGGPTQTMMPLVGSPVIDAGDNSAATLTDQRGFRRIARGSPVLVGILGIGPGLPVIDIGAVEYQRQDLVGRVGQNGQWWVGHSDGSSAFSNKLFATWSPAVTWVDVHTGDFTGDGRDDIVGRDLASGNWWVGVSNGSSFVTTLWGHWSPAVTWVDVQVGDFTGDGKLDIAGRVLQTGQWWLAQSTGSSFINSLWSVWSPAVTWVDVKVGDFNGDGKADITGRVLQSGQWWTGVSTGSSFTTSLWDTWSTALTWVDVNVGDFNGDGKADITGRVLQSGQWWTGLSTGSSFTTTLWDTWSTAVTWVDVKVADFNGDGMADIIGRTLQGGQWWVGQSTGSSFRNSLWATWLTAVTWVDVQVGDFNGDGKADITGRVLQNGQWWTGTSTGSSFNTSLWTTWSPAVTWVDVHVGEYANSTASLVFLQN